MISILKKAIIWQWTLTLRIVFSSFIPTLKELFLKPQVPEITDRVAKLFYFHPNVVLKPSSESEIVSIVKEAKKNNQKVSICGQRFSQGGQWCENDGILIDLIHYNKVLSLDSTNKTITVQSGITWKSLQENINPYGFAVKVMQSSNLFSVGGALSINCHGRDIRFGQIVNTVINLKVLLANGTVLNCSRTENSDLFFGIIGGMGNLGVILEATLTLRDNVVCRPYHTSLIPIEKFVSVFLELIKKDPELAFGRVTVSDQSFLSHCFISGYYSEAVISKDDLVDSEFSWVIHYLMALQRDLNLGKRIREFLESKTKTTQLISLNNAMNPAVQFLMYKERENRLIFKPFILSFTKLYRFLRRKPLDHTDVLREYFIPLNSFNEFINQMRVIFKENKVNLINITFRYVPKGEKVVLDYLKEDCIALVLNLNIGRAKAEMIKAQLWTKLLAQICLNLDGSFYLPYQPWETRLQVKAFYDIEFFKLLKNKYDVAGMFSNEYFKVMF